MEKFTIVTQGSATYLERTLGADELLDEVDRGMLVFRRTRRRPFRTAG